MPDSYAFEGWGNWPTWAVYLELSCDGSAWAKWVSVARRVRAEASERPWRQALETVSYTE